MTLFLYIVLILLSAFLVMIVLLQRGRGGGLAGAFGSGGGGQTAFGTKTGDVFTWVTVIAFVLFMLLSIGLFMRIKWNSLPDQTPAPRVKEGQPDAENITDTSLTLLWKDQSSNAIGYRIWRSSDGGNDYGKTPVGQVPANNPSGQYSFTDTGLTPGTEYYYQVEAWNNFGSKWSPSLRDQNTAEGHPHALHATTTGTKPLPVLPPAIEPVTPAARPSIVPTSAPATPSTNATTTAPAAPVTAPATPTTRPTSTSSTQPAPPATRP